MGKPGPAAAGTAFLLLAAFPAVAADEGLDVQARLRETVVLMRRAGSQPAPGTAARKPEVRSARRCSRSLYEDSVAEAVERLRAMEPGEAGRALERLQDEPGAGSGHLVTAMLAAARSQGYDLHGAVYCGEETGRWIGVSARAKGRDVNLIADLDGRGADGGPELSFSAEDPDARLPLLDEETGRPLSFAAADASELFSCGARQPDPNGAVGRLLERLSPSDWTPWEPSGACEASQPLLPPDPVAALAAPEAGREEGGTLRDYDPSRGAEIARIAKRTSIGRYIHRCYKYVMLSLEKAKVVELEDYRELNLPTLHAADFARWAEANPGVLRDDLGLARIPTPADPAAVPQGSVVVYKRGACGFSPKSGHIEIVVAPGRACSDGCGELRPDCFGSSSGDIFVYVPVKGG